MSSSRIARIKQEALNKEKTAPVQLSNSFLQKDIARGSVSPDGSQIFFLVPTTGGITGMIAGTDGLGQRKVFESAATEWS